MSTRDRQGERRRPANELDREALERLAHRLPAPPGLCGECVHLRILDSGRSLFVRCGLADTDPSFHRYPPLPVLSCRGFQPVAEEAPGEPGSPGS